MLPQKSRYVRLKYFLFHPVAVPILVERNMERTVAPVVEGKDVDIAFIDGGLHECDGPPPQHLGISFDGPVCAIFERSARYGRCT